MKHQDLIIHAAAQSAVDLSIKDPVTTFVTNSLGTVHVLEAMRHSGVKRLHYVSTDEVFGAATIHPFTEHSLVQPGNPYSAGKAAAESTIFAWANTYGIEVTITNGCNNYGARQAPEKLIPRLAIRGVLGKTLPVYGNGQQVREWVHVDDHAQAIWHVIQHGELGHRYCVGGTAVNNMQVVRKILETLVMDESKIEFVEDRLGHDVRYAVDMTKLRDLGWKPKINLEDGLRDTILWYRDNSQWWKYFQGQYDI